MELNIKVADWTIPYCGNKHCVPYGTLIVSDGNRKERCKTKGDKWDDIGPQYIVFNHRQYKVINKGTHKWAVSEKRNGRTIVLEEFIKWTDAEDWCYAN